MESNKVLSALCYFSVFIAPFLFPIIVYFVVDYPDVKYHAKKSLISHLVPLVTIPIFIIGGVTMGTSSPDSGFVIFMLAFIVGALLNVGMVIWNVVKGIQVLRQS